MLWGEVLEYWARWQPDKVGLKFEERDFTWAELDRRADELAAGLSNLGVGHGDRVGILLMNRPEFVEIGDGLHEARRHRRADQRPVHRARAGLRDRQRRLLGGGDRAGSRRGSPRTAEQRPSMPILDADDGTFDEARVPGGRPPRVEMEPDDPLFICYTSGTTGDPKGAVLTHRSWHYAALCRALQGGINLHDRLLLPFPLAFTGGLAMMLTALWSGSMLVLERAFDPTRCLRLIEELRITVFMAVPVIFQQLADHPEFDATDISSIRCASSGGATVPVSLLQTWIDRGIPMTQTYSLTEVSASGITLPYHEAFTRVGFCGVPAMHSQAKIVDEDGNECPPDVVGEIAIKGPEVMVGYWRNPEATAATLRDGWCHTGDLGLRDATGTSRWSTGPRTC